MTDMIISRTCDPIPLLLAWVHIRAGEVPWSITTIIIRIIINIPVRSISGVI